MKMGLMSKFKKLLKNQRGVTLIELLAVIVILGIIAAVAVPKIINTKSDAVNSAGQSDASEMSQVVKRKFFEGATYDPNAAADSTTTFNLAMVAAETSLKIANETAGTDPVLATAELDDQNGSKLGYVTLNADGSVTFSQKAPDSSTQTDSSNSGSTSSSQ